MSNRLETGQEERPERGKHFPVSYDAAKKAATMYMIEGAGLFGDDTYRESLGRVAPVLPVVVDRLQASRSLFDSVWKIPKLDVNFTLKVPEYARGFAAFYFAAQSHAETMGARFPEIESNDVDRLLEKYVLRGTNDRFLYDSYHSSLGAEPTIDLSQPAEQTGLTDWDTAAASLLYSPQAEHNRSLVDAYVKAEIIGWSKSIDEFRLTELGFSAAALTEVMSSRGNTDEAVVDTAIHLVGAVDAKGLIEFALKRTSN